MATKIPPQCTAYFTQRETASLRALNEELCRLETLINQEACKLNDALQRRKADPLDPVWSGCVTMALCCWSRMRESADSPLVERRYNCSTITENNCFGQIRDALAPPDSGALVKHALGVFPCCFLLQDIAEALFEKSGQDFIAQLLSIGDIDCDPILRMRFSGSVDV